LSALSGDGERRIECDTVAVGLGLQPRDALVRMGAGLNVRAMGDAARASDIPLNPVITFCKAVRFAR
jgi:hypothetical protein